MSRLRTTAAMLAALAMVIASLLLAFPAAGTVPPLVLAIAALVLALPTPFDASTLAARWRVCLACIAFVPVAAAAAALAFLSDAPITIPAMMLALAAGGAVLAIWAFRTRKRLRRRGWQNYFDN